MISKNKIKYIRSLELKKNRNKEGKFVAEGFKVVDDLLALQPADLIVATDEWLRGKHFGAETEVIEVTDEELKKVSFLQHPQQVLAVFRQATSGDYSINTSELSLALDGVQDPGNLGTIIRIADWFGITHIYCSQDTADVYNPKVVQATMGSIARVKVEYGDLLELVESLPADVPVYGTLLDGDNIYQQKLENHGLIVMGNEGKGISPALAKKVNHKLLIPNFPEGRATADSLNVAIATAITLTDKIFQSANGKSLEEAKPYTLHYGEIKDKDGNTIDDVLVSVFRAPHSYTGENSTEISCHGSRYILQQVLHRFTEVGCRQAEPGEYTRRAYLNGKMDLSQAEAVADLIASTNKATHKMALSQLKGHFSNELSLLREKLLKMTSLLELELDFSDHEELEFADRSELQALAEEINHKITTLAHSFETGNALKQGVAVAIVGKTNVGKSTLLNRLLHEEKAIVSDIHGTTRDVIEDTTLIDGITFRFIDTAGIRKTDDVVENIGIERTFQKMEEAKIVIWLLDDQPSASEIEEMKLKNQGKKLLVVFNKMDKLEDDKLAFDKFTHSFGSDSSESEAPLFISARTGENVSSLEQALVKAADIPEITENDVIITSARHYEALLRAHDSLSRVLESMEMGMSGDIVAEDLKMVLEELGEITGGQISSQETLNNIFKHFCIGK